MLDHLLTEQPNPASAAIDTVSTEAALRIINREDAKVAEAVERVIPAIARAVDAIADAMARGGRLFYIGAGTSGRLGAPKVGGISAASRTPRRPLVPAPM